MRETEREEERPGINKRRDQGRKEKKTENATNAIQTWETHTHSHEQKQPKEMKWEWKKSFLNVIEYAYKQPMP